ncbi:MAG: CRISPR system precrRNA processing endoribonuclease RAMP protein Cas6 [Candidatus Humimicrobiaceae bacterium]
MEITEFFKKIYFCELELKIKFLEDSYLPTMKGSTFRGGFGYMFKKISCPLKKEDCSGCMVIDNCPYSNVFTNPTEISKKTFIPENSFNPHPFVFDFYDNEKLKQNIFKKDEYFEFKFIVIGNATKLISYFIFAFIELGKNGIGKRNFKYDLISVKSGEKEVFSLDSGKIATNEIKILKYSDIMSSHKLKNNLGLFSNNTSPNNSAVTGLELFGKDQKYRIDLKFITPARIKNNKKYSEYLDFKILITNIVRRLYLFTELFCINKNENYEISEIKEYLSLAASIKNVNEDLTWYDWERYSTKQKTSMKLGGITGKISFVGEGNFFNQYIEPLIACEYLHVGKGTSFGLGKYEIKEMVEIN